MATIVTRAGKGSALTHNEVDANFTNLNSDKLEANSNITVANATVTGDLTVQGTTTTLNTATLQVEDKNITLNYSTGDSSGSADGAGITIQDAVSSSTDATILWDATNDTFDFSHALQVQGLVDIASGEIGLKNSGSVSNIKFYCEVSNAHYTALQSSPHSAYSGNVTLTLPPATDTLVGRATTDTLTNKTLTSPTVTGQIVISGTGGSATNSLDLSYNGSSGVANIQADSSGGNTSLTFGTSASGTVATRLTINSSGNVGIGATNPSGILHLKSDDNGMIFQSSSSSNSRAQIFFQNTSGTTTGKIAVDPDGGNANVMAFSTGSSERMRIDSNGDVQIHGTSMLASSILSVDGSGEVRNGVASKVNNDAYYTYAGINSSGTNTFLVYGDGSIDAKKISTTDVNVFARASGQPFYWKDTDATNGTQCNVYSYWYAQNTTLGYIGYGTSSNSHLYLTNGSVGSLYFGATSANGFLANGSVMWHAGNDGSGSGLDADLWDGNQFSSYLNQAVLTTSSPTFATVNYTNALYAYEGSNYVAQDPRWNASGYNANEGCHHMYCTTASGGTYGQVGLALYSGSGYVFLTTKSGDSNFYHNNNKMWSAGNDGSGSGLDADTCDGQHLGTTANVTHNRIYADDWFRVNGADGIYWESYGGGWYMSDTTWMRIYNSKSLYISNSIAASGNITAYYSDERLKTKTGSIKNALEKVQSLEGFTYVENELAKSVGYSNDEQQVGVSAQQVQSVLPEAVSLAPFDYETNEETGEITSKSGEEYLTVDYSRLVPLLIEAIKEQQAQIQELKEAVKWQ